jgi:predicted XRE-type DNA-binding protein
MNSKLRGGRAGARKRGVVNVYQELGVPDADAMFVKAQLVAQLSEVLGQRNLTQSEAAKLLGVPQPKLSRILRGQFRGISERKLMDCLAALGWKIRIVLHEPRRDRRPGSPGSISIEVA